MPPLSTSRISLPSRYRVIRHVANGGMASVWEACDELLGREVAVKLLATHLSEDSRARERFQREARAAAGLSNHPNVVTIYDVGEHDGKTFMVMELLNGGTLADKLRGDADMAPTTALRWLHEAASALDAAHEAGVVHRDVKPANMLLDDRGRLAIADFGIARLALEDQLTATGQVLGTAAYIAPEQAVGEPATAASDRYALACVAFELLTGERPFRGEHFAAQARAHVEDEPPPASERNARLPVAVDAVIARGLAKDPADRWSSSKQFVDELARALDEPRRRDGGGALPPTAATRVIGRPPTPGPRRRTGALLAGLAGLALLAVLAAVLLGGGSGDGEPTAKPERKATATPTAEKKERKQAEKTPEPTPEATKTAEPTPEATGGTDLAAARRLQVAGFRARNAGDYAQALTLADQALDACGDARKLDPCGYALYEKGAALNRLGRPDEAIPFLEQRLDSYGDSKDGSVSRELADAQAKAGGSSGKGNGKANKEEEG